MDDIERARKPQKLPVVFTREEVTAVLSRLRAEAWLMASLLYGSGLRLMECVRLRVKGVDFARLQITIREGKGAKDGSVAKNFCLHWILRLHNSLYHY